MAGFTPIYSNFFSVPFPASYTNLYKLEGTRRFEAACFAFRQWVSLSIFSNVLPVILYRIFVVLKI